MLTVHQGMMIGAKQKEVVGCIQFILGESWFSPWTIWTDRIDVTNVSDDDMVGFFGSVRNQSVSTFWVCTFVSAQGEQDFQCFR